MNRISAFLFLLSIFSIPASAEYSLIEVPLVSQSTISELQVLGMDIVQVDRLRNVVQIAARPQDENLLIASGIIYEVKIEDLESYYASRLGVSDDMGGYHTYSETVDELNFLHSVFPDIISEPFSIGQSLEGNELWTVKISDNPEIDEDEPEIFYNGLIHAREPITIELLLHYMYHLAGNYPFDPEVTYLIENREMFFLPIINPDGYLRNEETYPGGGGMWRKNMRDNNNSGYFEPDEDGVDLNRNWSYMWGYDDFGSSPDPGGTTYRGTAPFSEPETSVLRDFIISRQFSIVMNYHSYGNLYNHAWEYDTLDVADHPVFTELGAKLSFFNGYTVQPGVDLYVVNGGANDWQYGDTTHNRIISYVIEVGGGGDGFWPDEDRILPLAQENLEPNLVAANYADNPWRVLAPGIPTIHPVDTVESDFTLAWNPNTDPDNPAAEYDIRELFGFEFGTDDFEAGPDESWEIDGFQSSEIRAYSGLLSMHSGGGSNSNSLLQNADYYHVNPGDTLTFNTWYEIESDFDFGYVMVSYDGYFYTPIAGNITTNFNPHGLNLGNGITGNSDIWTQASFLLDDYAGEEILIAFIYKTGSYVNYDGWFIDDVYPHPSFDDLRIVAESHPDTSVSVAPGIVNGIVHYQVRAVDVDDEYSRWSQPEEVNVSLTGIASNEPVVTEFELDGIFPNPFNSSAVVNFRLARQAETVVSLYNVLGQRVGNWNLGILSAGNHSFRIDGNDLSGGIYFLKLKSGSDNGISKIVLVK